MLKSKIDRDETKHLIQGLVLKPKDSIRFQAALERLRERI